MRLKKGDVTVTLRYAKSRDMIWLRPYMTARRGMRSGELQRDTCDEMLGVKCLIVSCLIK
jgi:hypothetical protein